MDFALSEQQQQIQDLAAAFATEKLAPHSRSWDEDCEFPVAVLRELAELGFAGMYVRAESGGTGMSRLEAALVFEQLARGDVSVAAFLSIHNMVAWMVDSFGDKSLQRAWIPKLVSMEQIAAYCLTEPGSGSDAAALITRAEPEGNNQYRLTGAKAFVSGGGFVDVYAVMCRTGRAGPKGISCLLVPKDTAGMSFGAQERKMGWRSQPTAVVNFDGAPVPVWNRVGEEGAGFRYAMAGLDGGRINIAACSLGGAAWALEAARNHARERHTFGKPIAQHQAIAFKLAEMATGLQAARLMVWRAAAALDAGEPDATRLAAMAKMFATETCWQIVDEALQIHGGSGYIRDTGIEQRLRDLRVHRILEGTSEVMRLIVARGLLADD